MTTKQIISDNGVTYTVETDGRTVWVNDREKCVARFGSYGYEVHNKSGDWICGPSEGEWQTFTTLVASVLSITIPANFMPAAVIMGEWNGADKQ